MTLARKLLCLKSADNEDERIETCLLKIPTNRLGTLVVIYHFANQAPTFSFKFGSGILKFVKVWSDIYFFQ